MGKLKMFEITLEANSFDGNQVFACYATDEQEAMLKLKRGECDIIESNIEVLGLDKVPIDIMESDDITSRLLSDVCERQDKEIKELKEWQRLAFVAHPNIDLDIESAKSSLESTK